MKKSSFCLKLLALAPVLTCASMASANPGPFGVIVFSETDGIAGAGWGYALEADATLAAVADCQAAGGTGCFSRRSIVQSGCMAVARGDWDGSKYPSWSDTAGTQADAERLVLTECGLAGSANCQILRSGCAF